MVFEYVGLIYDVLQLIGELFKRLNDADQQHNRLYQALITTYPYDLLPDPVLGVPVYQPY